MYKRIRKPPAASELVKQQQRSALSSPPATLADFDLRIGSSDIIEKTDGTSLTSLAVFKSEFVQEEVLVEASAAVISCLKAPLPPPFLAKPKGKLVDLEAEKNWSEQEGGYGLQSIYFPLTAKEGEPRSEVLTRLGVWHRDLLLTGQVKHGSVLSVVDQIMATFAGGDKDISCAAALENEVKDWQDLDAAIIIANPGERFWSTRESATRAVTSGYARGQDGFSLVKGKETVELHIEQIIRGLVLPSAAGKIFVLAAEWSAPAVMNSIVSHHTELKERLVGIGLIESRHTLPNELDVDGLSDWIKRRTLSIVLVETSPAFANDTAKAEKDVKADAPDASICGLGQGCMVVASASSRLPDLYVTAPSRLLTDWFAFLDGGGDVTGLVETWQRLEALHREALAARPKVTEGLAGWEQDASCDVEWTSVSASG